MLQKLLPGLPERLLREQSGQDAIEFALLFGFMAFALGGMLPAALERFSSSLRLLAR